jgi:hypothetical protein
MSYVMGLVFLSVHTQTITVDKLAEGLRLETELPYNIAKGYGWLARSRGA